MLPKLTNPTMPVSDLVATVVMSDPFLLTVIFEPSTKSAWGLSTVFSHANVDNSGILNVKIKVTFLLEKGNYSPSFLLSSGGAYEKSWSFLSNGPYRSGKSGNSANMK